MATRSIESDSQRDERYEDPRMRPPGTFGMPAETIDTPHNMPGSQQTPPQPESREPDSSTERSDNPAVAD